MVNSPQLTLKIIVFTHLVLTVWATMYPNFLPVSYAYMNAFILACGLWSIVSAESAEASFCFLLLNLISIVMDIIFLGIFTPVGQAASALFKVHLFQFCLAMCIINLLLKPFTSFIIFRIYQDRGGQYGNINIPGLPNFGSNANRPGRGYEDIDQPVPSNNVETASPHFNQSPGQP